MKMKIIMPIIIASGVGTTITVAAITLKHKVSNDFDKAMHGSNSRSAKINYAVNNGDTIEAEATIKKII